MKRCKVQKNRNPSKNETKPAKMVLSKRIVLKGAKTMKTNSFTSSGR